MKHWLMVTGMCCALMGAEMPTAYAAVPQASAVEDSAQVDSAVLKAAQAYLNSVRTLKARFTQVAPDGTLATGTLSLKRPGKMRWQYDPPVPVLMVSGGSFLRYYDYELEQVSDIPIEDSIAGLLARKHVDFSDPDMRVLNAAQRDEVALVRLTRRGAEDEGELAFEFETAPYKLRNILLKDAKGEETNISLGDALLNQPLDDTLFELIDPNFQRRRTR